ncbi:hypothetical protein Thena_1648 [Thermodesulfobium narugense DSM 14796]|uniref:Uncharacterized protein n=1 Tax=Thermodesulfobium narugense DSM 14796 TaxID=747365 RepID=M1E8N3_9BACT|nr:hypothetical protein [Thermodesulfobium narugense]AEE15258.1 hypothetical protein Thena_1648 [Thermodesulfobium narugense DSM 14796]
MRGMRRGNPRWFLGQRGFYGNVFINNRSSVVFLIFLFGLIISLIMGKVELVLGWTAVFLVLWFLGFLRI